MSFLHGIETIEIGDGRRPITVADISVIGIVGTAPDAEGAAAAALTLDPTRPASALTATAVMPGVAGNAITIALVPGEASAPLAVAVVDTAITATLATDADGQITSVASEVAAAINDDPDAGAIVTMTTGAGTNGGGPVRRTLAPRALTGGADDRFPLDTPALIVGSQREAAALGRRGTLPTAIDGIFDQIGATIVVIRVEDGEDEAETMAKVIGGVNDTGNHTGLQALLDAQAHVGVGPRILVAPGFSQNVAVATELIGICDRRKAVTFLDGPDTTDEDAIAQRDNYGSMRAMLIDPWPTVFDTRTQTYRADPPSARAAGVTVRTDQEIGVHASPSNKVINGVVGTTRPVSFALSDPNTRANLLNANEVTTIVQDQGWRLWGNRTTAADAQWAFLSVRRTADVIEDSIEAALRWAIDKPFSPQLLSDIRDSVQDFLNRMKAGGAILGGRVWIDPELNTQASLKAGQLFLDYDFEPPAPLERLTLRARRNGDYYTDLIADAAA